MGPVTLYLIVLCHGFTAASPPCSAPFFYADHKPNEFQRTRENCLNAARAVEAKDPTYRAYCVSSNGAPPLNSAGVGLSEREHYEALERWYAAQERKTLSSK